MQKSMQAWATRAGLENDVATVKAAQSESQLMAQTNSPQDNRPTAKLSFFTAFVKNLQNFRNSNSDAALIFLQNPSDLC